MFHSELAPCPLTIELQQALAWLALAYVGSQACLCTEMKLTPVILWQRMQGPHLTCTSCVYLLCSGCDVKQGKSGTLGPRMEAGLQEQLKTGKPSTPFALPDSQIYI